MSNKVKRPSVLSKHHIMPLIWIFQTYATRCIISISLPSLGGSPTLNTPVYISRQRAACWYVLCLCTAVVTLVWCGRHTMILHSYLADTLMIHCI